MKTTLLALLGVSLFLGGCGSAQMTGTVANSGPFGTAFHTEVRDNHATLDWNAAAHPLALPSRLQK